MEKYDDDDRMELPPGFRFHPTDEELITHYLTPKVLDICFSARAIGEVDLNKSEPWDLPWRAKMGEKEWYFFCNEWVICRVFQKSCGGKKTHIQGMVKLGSFENNMSPSVLPPLMDSSPNNNSETITAVNETSHVTCFSDPMEDQKTSKTQEEDMIDSFNTCFLASSNPLHSVISPVSFLSKSSVSNSFYANQILPNIGNLPHYPDAFLLQDQSILKILLENHGPNPNPKTEFSQDSVVSNQEDPSTSGGPVDLDCLWNY
ncbi:hypothetical protein LWI29_026389 [Acer saccharum]|uniref:NAC domain-containing protein n=1 Tax=Acer saccharum TaxID=4024 RepID=A0AA39VN62_ACESA|nr:hypothetical protein LWI29_026389 [Acer saccharum]